jgi:hypothetical protein
MKKKSIQKTTRPHAVTVSDILDTVGQSIFKGFIRGTVELLSKEKTETPEMLLAKALWAYIEHETLGTCKLTDNLLEEFKASLIRK